MKKNKSKIFGAKGTVEGKMQSLSLLVLSLIVYVASGSLPIKAYGAPIVPGFTVSTYATVTDPIRLSFDPSGVLYVGRDNTGSGGGSGDPVKIHRIGVGGSPVVDYGVSAIDDPDAVLFDAIGLISGTPGSVLVGGEPLPSGAGKISVIKPDQSVSTLFGPTSTFINPQDMTFDSTGRLLFTDTNPTSRKVFVSTGGFPSTLFSIPTVTQLDGIAVDAADRIFTSATDGIIRVHDSAGGLINGAFATGLGSNVVLTFGAGGAFGTDLYAIGNGNLLRYDALGNATVLGTGFVSPGDLAFGPDNALYVSEFSQDRILRIAPVPVPSALLLFGSGMAGLVVTGLRRRKL